LQTQQAKNWAVAIVLGSAGTVQYHRAQFTSRFDTVFGDRGDVRGVIYFCEHWYQWLIGKADLMSPGIFYPTKHTLAYSDFLLGYAIPYSVVRLLGFGMFSSIEIVVILSTFLSYLTCYLLLKHVLNFKLLPACVAAMFFAFSSAKFHQLLHAQLQYVILLPLIFACVILFVRKSQELSQREATGWLTAAGILWLLQATTAFYHAWFMVLWTLLFALFVLSFRSSRPVLLASAQKSWRAIVAAVVVLFFGFALFLRAYLPGLRSGQWYEFDFVLQMIPTWWSVLWMGDGNYLWGWLSSVVVPNPRPSTWNELRVGFGLIPTLAWVFVTIWIVLRVRTLQRENGNPNVSLATPAFLAASVLATTLFFLIGFNYGNHSPWFFVYEYFPGGKAIRAVARYAIFLSLPMAIAFAFLLERGLAWAAGQESKRTRTALTAAIMFVAALGVFEQFGVFKANGAGFSKKAEETYLKAMAAKLPNDCAAFYIAPGGGTHSTAEYHYDAMMISIMTRIPTLNASSSQFPRGWDMYHVSDPNYEGNVKKWIESQGIKGKVCRLDVGPQVEAFDVHSPLDDAAFFVRQQYLDFAGREPNAEVLAAYVARLKNCKREDVSCKRENISLEILRNSDFFEDGSLIFRLYQIAFERPPRYDEFKSDLAALRDGQSRARFVDAFVGRAEFVNRYSGMSDQDYAMKLHEQTEGSLPDSTRQTISTDGKSRAEILLNVANNPGVTQKFTNRAFVTLHYFGYLGRDPDAPGFANWLQTIDRTGNFQQVTSGFVNSVEYRQRFGSL